MNLDSDFVELRSEEVQEILTRPPKWLLRWGVTIMFLMLVMVFTGSWMIHYPDLVRASFKLTAANSPKAVQTRTNGKLVQLFVQDGQLVRVGETLAYLESTAKHADVLQLSNELHKAWHMASRGNLEGLHSLKLANYNRLGELQNTYQTFEQARIQLQAYLANGFYSRRKQLIYQEIIDLQALAENLRVQQQIQERDVTLAQEDYAIQQQLARDKVIALLDLKREESKSIARKIPYQQTASALISNLTVQRSKQKEILELEKQVVEERDKFLQALTTLQSAVDAWHQKYVLTAPETGRVFFAGVLQANQMLAMNQEVLFVAPPSADYFGELFVPQQNAGKVRVGQKVLIKFVGYPYQEFGIVSGRIVNIADIPLRDSVFLAKVVLPAGLKTTYGRSLAFKTGMTASGEIVTNDNRLFEKLFYQFRKIAGGE